MSLSWEWDYTTDWSQWLVPVKAGAYDQIDRELLPLLPNDSECRETAWQEYPEGRQYSDYIQKNASYPVYQNTDVIYYDEAVKGLEAQLADLAKAEKFIFMEYHAIEDAQAWHKIQRVLEDRVKAGVEVRVFYDDMGSIGFINTDFIKKMENVGTIAECSTLLLRV